MMQQWWWWYMAMRVRSQWWYNDSDRIGSNEDGYGGRTIKLRLLGKNLTIPM